MSMMASSGRTIVWGSLPVAALLVLAGLPLRSVAQPATQSSAVPITTTSAIRRDVPISVRALGTVQAYYAVQLRARVDGTLTQVPVKEGEEVKQGDLLAVIDTRPYRAVLDASMAKKQQDQAQLLNAEADLARYASLVQQNFATRQQYDTQSATVKQLSAGLLADDAQIESAQLNLSFCYITAPFAGRIGLRNVDPGNVVHSAEATPIISITQIQPITIIFTVPQDELPTITRAMTRETLGVVAYESDKKTELARGILLTPDNTIDTATGTIRLKAEFPNTDRMLWPGRFVNVRLQLGVEANVLTVAANAVQHGPNGLYVYRIDPGDTVSIKPIEVTGQVEGIYIVSAGLIEGDSVVATGQARLQAGTPITVMKTGATLVKSVD